ncbi:hypothetical protein B566_EDAN007885 [Ephemera danica]|nr:hypothetical protein B566_EDAN007885 [Ephemera danica]
MFLRVPGSSERTEDEAHGDIPIRVSSSDSCRPVRAISIDDDSENVEVDLREHDWRFDLQALHEEPQDRYLEVVTTQTRTTIGPDGEPVTVTETTETTTEEAAASLASLSRHSPDHFVERN